MLRLPEDMRGMLKLEAERNGRSMNAEIIARLDYSFQEIISNEGLVAVSKRLAAAAEAFENVFIETRDLKKARRD